MNWNTDVPKVRVWLITLFFLLGGAAHFLIVERFVSVMPAYLPWPRELVLISGGFELLGAVGVLFACTRRWAGCGLVLLCLAVFPANLNMALHAERFNEIPAWLLYLRLPLQALIILHIVWATELLRWRGKVSA
ncbi:MAG: DoxX family protein [Halopseudomonas sabulinigri]